MATRATASGYDSADARGRDKYLARLSGPLLDRIDIHIEVPTVPYSELTGRSPGTGSDAIRKRVAGARKIQHKRFEGSGINAAMTVKQMKDFCELSEGCLLMMRQAMTELGLSARAYDKVRRVARTIADLEEAAEIREHHLAEAIQYRLLDRRF